MKMYLFIKYELTFMRNFDVLFLLRIPYFKYLNIITEKKIQDQLKRLLHVDNIF